MREYYDIQLNDLNNQIIEMGSLVEKSVAYSAMALVKSDIDRINKVSEYESAINRKEKDIESLCVNLIMHNQPVAKDLRFISAALKLVTDLERIGDHAEDIAEISKFVDSQNCHLDKTVFSEIADTAVNMVNLGVDAFIKRDLDLAQKVAEMDNTVDQLFIEIRQKLVSGLKSGEYDSAPALDLFLATKYFERIGDHAVNIAEWVVYSLTGKLENLDDYGIEE
ncbi:MULTISPECIES: phosphate signaling complex protein PhoU [unclassified Ruminococcus]|uniref:phosphate signaling complex protein PhoU n=1 Tax=unclassified Ruminococcus TaxID=2608920 RepID=UPI00210E79DE|nr:MULTISPECIES: phosphate signaling complex protein PhoU [unclassified Ruminococcus]MCQ4022205.1 phosphate signaling complex protein PhoU [Ruminococcus sp. zg-924]MCQ4115232.1 phosphate signaling complex protein PhoU [Ruminococcus sp. zg-921]